MGGLPKYPKSSLDCPKVGAPALEGYFEKAERNSDQADDKFYVGEEEGQPAFNAGPGAGEGGYQAAPIKQ